MKNLFPVLLVLLMGSPLVAKAQFLPEKRAPDPSLSVVLFEDPYTGFLLRSDNRTLGSIAVSLPLYGIGADTVYAFTGIEATLRNQGASFNSESMDLRVGAKWVHALTPQLHLALGLSHTSGHVVDDVIEKDLEPFNVGIDGIPVRAVFDTLEHLRFGVHGLFPMGSEPATRRFTTGLFTEYYFSSSKLNQGWMLGSHLYLPENARIVLSTITEIAYRYQQASFMLGFHTGADVRLKHQLYLKSQVNFGFAGFRFQI